jgi:hypothetical protein
VLGITKFGTTVAPAVVAIAVNAAITSPVSKTRLSVVSPLATPTSITHEPESANAIAG